MHKPHQERQKRQALEDLFGQQPASFICDLVSDLAWSLRITAPRKSKFGDYRYRADKKIHEISINRPLDEPHKPRALLTLIHELAHARVRADFGTSPRPHGHEWKRCFGEMIELALNAGLFPEPLVAPLTIHAQNPRARAGVDRHLEDAFDALAGSEAGLRVEDLAQGELFSLGDGKLFRRGRRLRSRYECTCLAGGQYRIQATAKVVAHGAALESQEPFKKPELTTVGDLPKGQYFKFSSRARLIFRRGKRLGNSVLCQANNRKWYRIDAHSPVYQDWS